VTTAIYDFLPLKPILTVTYDLALWLDIRLKIAAFVVLKEMPRAQRLYDYRIHYPTRVLTAYLGYFSIKIK